MNAETTPVLQVTNIHQPFGRIDALHGVNLILMLGGVVALLNVNGMGKNTFLDTVLDLATPTQSDVSVRGVSPRGAVCRSLVSVMFQTGSVPHNGKVRNTVDLTAAIHANPTPADELLGRTNLTKLVKHPLNRLSGGERQRMHPTLTLAGNPEFLIPDKSTTGTDALACHAFWETMRAGVVEGRILPFATYYLTETHKNADRIVTIDIGKVLLDALTKQVTADNEDFRDVFKRTTPHTDAE